MTQPQLEPGQGHEVAAHHDDDQVRHDIHVKGVPTFVWRRARLNALLSNMSFKDYVTRLLAEGRFFPNAGRVSLAPTEYPPTDPEAVVVPMSPSATAT